jgi:hypothetical protein
MIMADILMWALILGATYVIIVCYWLLASALFAGQVGRCQERYTTRPVRTTIAGLLTLVPLLVLAAVVGKVPHPAIQVSALILGLACILIGLFGSAGLAQRVGEGLASRRDEREPWRRVRRGGLVLAITFFLPFIGWFLVLPITLISGFGAFILSIPRPHRATSGTTVPSVPSSTIPAGTPLP